MPAVTSYLFIYLFILVKTIQKYTKVHQNRDTQTNLSGTSEKITEDYFFILMFTLNVKGSESLELVRHGFMHQADATRLAET